jgi:beta-N-acetylhexosaminidase
MSLITPSYVLSSLTTTQKIGQLYFPAAYINESDAGIREVERWITDYGIGGLTFFHSRAAAGTAVESGKGIPDNPQSFQLLKDLIAHYQSLSAIPLLTCIDAEWGLRMRVENTPQYPYAITLGAMSAKAVSHVYEVGRQIGHDLKAAGIHLNMAPVADINDNPRNPVISYRSFGSHKDKVGEFALAFSRGMQASGVASCFKHFPGHGNTEVDSHLGLPVVMKSLEEALATELAPFAEGILGQVDSIMIGHVAIPSLSKGRVVPATLSKEIIKGLLRQKMGFQGVTISDALNMKGVSNMYTTPGELDWRAFEAGNDALCFSEHLEAGIKMIHRKSAATKIEESVLRLLALKQKLGILTAVPLLPQPHFSRPEIGKINHLIAEQAISEVVGTSPSHAARKAALNGTLRVITLGPDPTGDFAQAVKEEFQCAVSSFSENWEEAKNLAISDSETLVVAVFLPSQKPAGEFGWNAPQWDLLKTLVQHPNVILYWFGSPFALPRLPQWRSLRQVVVAYQPESAFQQAAARHLAGQLPATGQLPVNLP